MSDPVAIKLMPMGKTLTVERGMPLQEVLFDQGVEFPCGGKGRCKGCKVKLLSGDWPATADDARVLSQSELVEGWRLACRATATRDSTIEMGQWEAPVLADDSPFEFTPRDGLGVAVDLGTTTLVAQLLNMRTGYVLGVRTALNAQAQQGADIMSRIDFALHEGGLSRLSQLIRTQIGGLVQDLLDASAQPSALLKDVVIVGNTVMHHLFCGLDVTPLAHVPFKPTQDGLQVLDPEPMGWTFAGRPVAGAASADKGCEIRFLPCLGGFVGSDILAGILATNLHKSDALSALIDLGTNGEIVVGNAERMLCASTAAGPAFEGARISMGMRAATGAISEVVLKDGEFQCHVLGHVPPRGICGSGLVDAAARALELGWIDETGRMTRSGTLSIAPPVELTQSDIRELQLAKGAIAAGLRILVRRLGAEMEDVSRVYLAGAFGNYINRASARRIGLFDFPPAKVHAAGNTALLGAKLALASLPATGGEYTRLRRKIHHLSLHEDPEFHEIFVEDLLFPEK